MSAKTQPIEFCFYQPGECSIVDIARLDGRSWILGETLEQVRLRYPGVELVPWPEVNQKIEAAQAAAYHVGEAREIMLAEYNYALNVLPPARWQGSIFAVSEMLCGRIASWYCKAGGKYWEVNHYIDTDHSEINRICQEAATT